MIRKADRLLSRYVILRDGHCVTCGSMEALQCGHLFSRASYSTRWDDRNVFCQCRGCNLRHEYDPGPLTLVFLERYGKEDYEALHRKYRTPCKYTNKDLEDLVEALEAQIRIMEGGDQ